MTYQNSRPCLKRTSLLCTTALIASMSMASAKDTLIDDLLEQAETKESNVEIGNRSESGNNIEWTDVVISSENGDGWIEIDWIKLEEISSTEARVTIAPSIRIFGEDTQNGKSGEFEFASSGLEYILKESGGSVEQAFSATSVALRQVAGDIFNAASLEMSGVSGAHIYRADDMRVGTGNMTANAVTYVYDVSPEEDGAVRGSGTMNDLVTAYSFDGSSIVEGEDPDPALISGAFSMTSGASSGTSSINVPGEVSFDVTTTGESFDVEGQISDGEMSYGGSAIGIQYGVALPMLGISNADITLGSADFEFAMPLAQSDDEKDMRLKFALNELVVDEALWAMFDPGKVLPRDPATVDIDVDGKAIVKFDLTDADNAAPGAMPVEVTTADVNTLNLSAAGANIQGSGSVDVTYNGPIPAPIGSLEFSLSGINGLLDNLATMGLLQPEQAMPARMMLSMFAVPVGDDQLQSVIEFKEDGSILANGQRIR